jgi:hypothetical protein
MPTQEYAHINAVLESIPDLELFGFAHEFWDPFPGLPDRYHYRQRHTSLASRSERGTCDGRHGSFLVRIWHYNAVV